MASLDEKALLNKFRSINALMNDHIMELLNEAANEANKKPLSPI